MTDERLDMLETISNAHWYAHRLDEQAYTCTCKYCREWRKIELDRAQPKPAATVYQYAMNPSNGDGLDMSISRRGYTVGVHLRRELTDDNRLDVLELAMRQAETTLDRLCEGGREETR